MSNFSMTTTMCLTTLVAVAGCSRTSESVSESQSAAISDSVTSTLDAYNDYYSERDWEGVLGFYADDSRFVWVEDGVVRYRSATDIRQALESLPPSMEIATTYSDTEISVLSSNIASVVTGFETRFADSTGSGFSFAGTITMTLVREEGSWRILSGHTSSLKRRGS